MGFVQELDQVEQLRNRIADLEAQLQDKDQKLNQERQSSERKFRALTNELPIIVYAVDTNGIITMSEGKGLAVNGLKPGQTVGTSAYDLYKNYSEATAGLKRALAGESFQFVQKTAGYYMQTWYSPTYDEDGKLNGTLGLMIDVSDRVRTEDELQESRNLLQLVLDAIPVRVFWKDKNSTYMGSNQLFSQDAKVASTSALIGKTDFDFYPHQAEAYRADDLKVITSGKSVLNFEERQTTPDNKDMWLRTSKIPLHNVAGEIVGVLGMYDDITERKEADTEFRESKERLELAFGAANLASWDWNMVTNFVIYDDGFNRMLGYEPGELGNDLSGFQNNLHPEDMERTFKAVSDYTEGRAPKYDTEFRLKHKDGSWRWVAATGLVVERQDDGKTVRMIGVNQDITARKQADMELQASKDRIELAMTGGQLGSWQINLKTNKTVFDARYEKILGFAPGELAGENPTHISDLHPDDIMPMFEKVMNYVSGKTPEYNAEFRTKTKAGDWKWISAKAQIVEWDTDGSPILLSGINQDITERKQAEFELRESKEHLELAMDIAELGSWEANLTNNKTLFDARYEKMLGFAPGELAGENPTHTSDIHPDDMAQLGEVVMNYVMGKTPEYIAEFRTSTKDGGWKWIYAKAQIVERLPDGTPVRLSGVNQDITARKLAEQEREVLLTNEREARREAQEALRMKDLFLATMSHELRTPLNAMIGFQHLMLFSQQLDADNSHMAERSIANSQRLLNLINNILDISRIATGGLKIVPVNMSPRGLAMGIGTDLSLQAKEKGLNLKVEVADDVPENILHDEERMGQIMLNLVGNALKFTEVNGTITLRVRSGNERLVIEVQDTGIGIPASQKHVIFDDFVQLDNSSTRKHQGAGLGLAIVKRLALLMQGSITVESEIGQGSTFVVTLPLNLNPEMFQ